MTIAIYPGSFDPITYGHMDIVERATKMFAQVYVVVAVNPKKKTLFTLSERMEMAEECLTSLSNVKVSSFEGLTVDCLKKKKAQVILRGIRAVTDFEYEFQMALMNKKLDPGCETVHLMSDEKFTYLNSSIVREIATLGGNIEDFVPPPIQKRLRMRFPIVNCEKQL